MRLGFKSYRILFVVIMTFILIFTCKQAPTDAPIIQTQITGKVTDSKSTQPIVGAQITSNPATSSVVTGNDGNYTIPDVKPAQYTITAKKDGYIDNTTTVTVIEGKTVNADIQLNKLSPEIEVSPTTLDFETTKNDLSFFITNKGKVGTITWTISSTQPWVSIIPTTGTTTAETDPIQVTVSRNNIAIGTYTAQIKITSDAGEKTISVLMVKPDPNLPQLSISPTSIDFGSSILSSQIEIKNTGFGVMNWTSTPSNNWINLSSTSGNINAGDKSIINVSVSKNGLAPGNFNGSVVFNSNGGSKTLTITMIVPPGTAPNAPVLLAPSDGATNQLTTPTLSWNASVDATSYTLQVSQNSAFTSYVYNQNVGNVLNKQISALSNSQTYYWRVSASNSYGTSTNSNTWSFTTIAAGTAPNTPALSSPSNNAINISISPTLSWNTSTDATSYTLQVSQNSGFNSYIFNQSVGNILSKQISGLSNSQTYYWRVSASNSYGTSTNSNAWSFTTIAAGTAPNAPALSSPANNAINISIPPTLSWNASDRASGYTLQVSTSNSFGSTVYNQIGLTNINQQVNGLSNSTKYYWRVNATNNYGTSSWSETWSFSTGCVATVTHAGKIYNTVQIGNQCWLKENLDVGTMINGSVNAINNGTIEKYCYNNDPKNCATYGGLYQWDEAMGYSTTERSKGICPDGWHIPTNAEFEILNKGVNYDANALISIGQKNGSTNASGFSVLLGGELGYMNYFTELGTNSILWSSTEYDSRGTIWGVLVQDMNRISSSLSFYNPKNYGNSIRCLKD